jgi:ligand-binding sensor domain-containing protein
MTFQMHTSSDIEFLAYTTFVRFYKKKALKGLALLALLLSGPRMHAQEAEGISFKKISSENTIIEKGLSQNMVLSIFQDDKGFMWFGTWDGLNRFDAYNFDIFSKEQGLSSETIRAIFQDGNKLWIGTENGLNAMDMHSGEIQKYFSNPLDSTSLTNNWINHIFRDHLDRLWICTAAGLSEFIRDKNEFRQIFSRNYDNPMRSNHFNMMTIDKEKDFWIATNYGLVHFVLETGVVTRYYSKPDDKASLPSNQVKTVITDENGHVWVGTARGLVRFLPETKQFERIKLLEKQGAANHQPDITSLAWESEKGLWAGTDGEGLFFMDAATGQVDNHTQSSSRLYSLSDNRVQKIYIDNQGIIWIGTFNGLNKIDRNAPRFRLYRNDPTQTNTINSNFVWCFEETKENEVWIGTDAGISIFDQTNFSFRFITRTPDNPNTLASNQVRSIYKAPDGQVWIGTRDKGLSIYNVKNSQFLNLSHNINDSTSLSDNFVFSINGPSDGTIWVATNNGLNKYLPGSKNFKRYYHEPNNPNSLPNSRVYSIYLDNNEVLWVSTANGLARYRPQTDNFITYMIPESMMRANRVYTNQFFEANSDKTGNLWIGTRGGGLVKLNPQTEVFEIFTQHDGLPNNVVYAAAHDQAGNFWVTTNWGLSRYIPSENSFINYDVTDGIQSNEFNLNAMMMTSMGQVFVGGMNGFNTFYPESIKTNTQPPPVRITAFKKFNIAQPIVPKSGDTIRLNYNDNFFTFEFTALDYTNPSKNKFRFMLQKYDADWIERGADKRFAEYANIKPGTYQFKVIAANSDGYWNEEGTSLTIIIRPPWYATYFFRISALLLLIILSYSIIRMRVRAINRKHEVEKNYLAFEKQLFELEQKALQLQMNPHFMFNSLNSIQSFVLKNDTDNAIRYLSKFSQLMRRTLANSRESMITVKDEIQALALYLEIEKLRFDEKFDFNIEIEPEIDDSFIEIPPMILQPYVENAIIHGLMHSPRKGHLRIHISLREDTIVCSIEDDGIGRKKAAEIKKASGIERKSQGMLITKERLDMLNQYSKDQYTVEVLDLMDADGKPAGTRVEVTILYREL